MPRCSGVLPVRLTYCGAAVVTSFGDQGMHRVHQALLVVVVSLGCSSAVYAQVACGCPASGSIGCANELLLTSCYTSLPPTVPGGCEGLWTGLCSCSNLGLGSGKCCTSYLLEYKSADYIGCTHLGECDLCNCVFKIDDEPCWIYHACKNQSGTEHGACASPVLCSVSTTYSGITRSYYYFTNDVCTN